MRFIQIKQWFVAIVLLCCATTLFALDVDTKEIQSAGSADTIVFQNYTGPHVRIDSAAAITSIGTALGRAFTSRRNVSGTAGDPNRYYVIHAIDPDATGKLDADILILGSGAGVDHIDNVRRILSGYLRQSYGYSATDAATLATFITVYNAVYRGKLSVFTERYKDVVTKHLSAEKVGIAINYKEWPGNTQLVIPLSDVQFSSLSTIDTTVISDKNVVDSMRTDEDKNIDARKDMVDIKEREADIAAEQSNRSQKEAAALAEQAAKQDAEAKKAEEEAQALQAQADAAKAEAEKAAAAAEQAKAEADQAKQQAEESGSQKDKQAADEKDAAAQKAQQTAEQKAENAEAKQSEADAKKQAAEDAQKKADQTAQDAQAAADKAALAAKVAEEKQSSASEDRKDISKDMQNLIEEQKANAEAPTVEGMILTNAKEKLSGIVRVNLDTGKVIKTSPVTVIRNRTLFDAGTVFIAIAGESGENQAVKLVQLDKNAMEIVKESDDLVSPDSVLIQNGSSFYCVIQNGKEWYLAEYDAEITKKHVSTVAIDPSSPVTVTDKGIMVTGSDKKIKILSADDLSVR